MHNLDVERRRFYVLPVVLLLIASVRLTPAARARTAP
jgi:hypothetical protein